MCSCRDGERERWIPSAPAFLDTGPHPAPTWRGARQLHTFHSALFKASRGSGNNCRANLKPAWNQQSGNGRASASAAVPSRRADAPRPRLDCGLCADGLHRLLVRRQKNLQ